MAVGLGALLSGCRFYSAYPMTPSTGVLNFMADAEQEAQPRGRAGRGRDRRHQHGDRRLVCRRALHDRHRRRRFRAHGRGRVAGGHDRDAAWSSSWASARRRRPASRPAPSRATCCIVLHAAHGEFPRVIMAPGDPEQAFYLTNKAFDLAEKYQIPAFILSDQYLADTEWTLEGLDTSRLYYQDYRLRAERAGRASKTTNATPLPKAASRRWPSRALPATWWSPTATSTTRRATSSRTPRPATMVEKRLLRKLPLIREEISPPRLIRRRNPETVVCGWGSNLRRGEGSGGHAERRAEHRHAALQRDLPFPGTQKFDYLRDPARGADAPSASRTTPPRSSPG